MRIMDGGGFPAPWGISLTKRIAPIEVITHQRVISRTKGVTPIEGFTPWGG